MVTLLPLVSPGLSYISVVWEKLGMAMAGATAARDTDKLTGLSAPVLTGAGTKVTYPVVACCCGVTLATGIPLLLVDPGPDLVEAGPELGSWIVLGAPVMGGTGARDTVLTSFMFPAGTTVLVLGGPTGTMGTWMWVAAWDTTVTRPPAGTRTGTEPPPTGLGLRATGAPDTDGTWVVMGLKTPAGFWVTMVLVTAVPPAPVGDRMGLAEVTRGPVGRKLTAAIAGVLVATGRTVPGLGVEVRGLGGC